MDQQHLERLLRRVSDTEADELSCSECFDLLATGVELELAGQTGAPLLRRLAQHLGQCGVCREEYAILRDFVRSDAEATPPVDHGSGPRDEG